MRNFSKAFLVFIVFALIAQFLHQDKTEQLPSENTQTTYNNKIREEKQSELTTSIKDTVKSYPIKKDSINTKIEEVVTTFNNELTKIPFNHKFVTSSNNTRVIFPKQFHYFKDSIFNFLNNNQKKEIIITALYLENETINNSNFGQERANYLKNKLVNYGVNPNRILTKSKIANYQYDLDGYFADGVIIEHQNMDINKQKLIDKEISNKILHSYFGDESFKPDRTLYAYTMQAKNYLKQFPTKKITITGHTDNVGEEKTNEWIGLQRAKNVANYFIQQGIDSTKVFSNSKGETTPIDDNNTLKGRANNRRIEIIIN